MVEVIIRVSDFFSVNARIFASLGVITVVLCLPSVEGSAFAGVLEVVAGFHLFKVADGTALSFEIVGFGGASLEGFEFLISELSVD